MAKREQTLLDQIELEALDEERSLASVLRKCVVLGGQARSRELRDWATQELKGYGQGDVLPGYRTLTAVLQLDGTRGNMRITGQQLAPAALPDFVREAGVDEHVKIHQGIGELEAIVLQATQSGEPVRLSLPGGADIALYMNAANDQLFQNIDRIYWSLSPAALRGVIDQVRTGLAQLVAELRATMPEDRVIPSAEEATQAVNVAVTGKRSRVTITSAQATGHAHASSSTPDPVPPESPFWTRSRRIGAFTVGIATIVGSVAALIAVL